GRHGPRAQAVWSVKRGEACEEAEMVDERFEGLRDALVQAFPSDDALRELLFKMGHHLSHVTTARAVPVMVLDILQFCDARGRIEELITSACALRPQNHQLAQFVQRHWPELQRIARVPE